MEPTRHQGPTGGTGDRARGADGFGSFGQQGGTGGMPDGGPLRRMVGGISAVMVIVWTLLCLAFYALIELLGNLLVWLSRSVFEAQDLADFFAGVFGFLQDLGFVTIAVIWLIGVILAVPLAIGRGSKRRWIKLPIYAHTYVFRGTPLLIQLYLVYYGVVFFDGIQDSIFWGLLRDPFFYATLTFTLSVGAYSGEILRGALLSVPPGEREAGFGSRLRSSP